MGLIDRIAHFAGYEKRDAAGCDPSWLALSNGFYAPSFNQFAAENIATILGCVNAICRQLASVDTIIYRNDASGTRIEQPGHPFVTLIRRGVNDLMSWESFREHMFASVLLHGNALATIQRDGRGAVEALTYVPWGNVSVAILSSGRLAYNISDPYTGRSTRWLQGEVLHFRDRSDDGGRIGRSRISRAFGTVKAIHDANTLSGAVLRNGSYPSGFLTAPGAISNETAARLKADWGSNFSSHNAGKVAVGGDGLKYEALQFSPEDSELLNSRRFGSEEICRIYDVPPPIVQNFQWNTYTNAAQAGLWFAIFCLQPWAQKFKSEFSRAVFSDDGTELELDLSSFLKGDPQVRWGCNKIAIDSGILTADEVRQQEGWNPLTSAQKQTIKDARPTIVTNAR